MFALFSIYRSVLDIDQYWSMFSMLGGVCDEYWKFYSGSCKAILEVYTFQYRSG